MIEVFNEVSKQNQIHNSEQSESTHLDNQVNQSKLEVNACSWRIALEDVYEQVLIGFPSDNLVEEVVQVFLANSAW